METNNSAAALLRTDNGSRLVARRERQCSSVGGRRCAVGACVVFLFLTSAFAQMVSLSGGWRFALDRDDAGVQGQWYQRRLTEAIVLPGVLQAQGYGETISVATPWVLSLYDKLWYLREDYRAYTNAAVKVPFLCQPPRHYVGAAWYQRDINIPADWKGRSVTLFLERVNWESRVWVDDQLIGTNHSLCAPHEFELGRVGDAPAIIPGRHRLTVRIDNRLLLPYRLDAHSVSDSLGSSWNGIVGRMELAAGDAVSVRQMRLDPDLSAARVKVTLFTRNRSGKDVPASTVRLEVVPGNFGGKALPPVEQSAVIPAGDASLTFFFPMTERFERWSEFNPKFYKLFATVAGKGFHSDLGGTFGMREFQADGTDFVLNGRKTYLRGTHNGGDFPLTGYPPADVASWRKIFLTCRQWGLNHMRFHSFCPPEAAFAAADELGFYLQIEPGMWNDLSPGTPMEKMLYEETDRILEAYGNHPSFVLFSASNEAHGNWKPCLTKWVEHYRAADSRRLYTPDTGWPLIDSPGPVSGADYLSVGRIGLNRTRGESAWFGRDYGRSLTGVNVPVVAHELGQWCAYPDFRVIKKFNGYLRPVNYEIFRDSLAAHGLGDRGRDFARASGRFQLACYKEEIEANLRTPGLAGFQLLDLHDYMGQGTALVGLLDPFWEEKGYAKPEEFREFCNTVVPLARLTRRVFTTADAFDVPLEAANFSPTPLTNAVVCWKIVNASSRAVAAGSSTKTLAIGKNLALGSVSASLAALPAPAQYKLVAEISDPSFANEWSFWLYPSNVSDAVPANVFVTSSWEDAEAKLAAGGNVLFLPRNADLSWDSPPLAELPVFWNRLMNPAWGRMLGLWCDAKHPALAGFPTEENCDWQWTQIIRGVRAVNLDRLPHGVRPIVQAIDDWNRNWKLGVIFECKVGKGKLLVSAFDLAGELDRRPVARQLRRSLLDYMASRRFNPQVAVSPAEFRGVLFDNRIMRELGASVSGEGNASAAIDGDPNTAWIAGGTGRGASGTKYPHVLTLRFPAPVTMNGVMLMPRQNDRDHLGDVRSYVIETSADGSDWREIARGELASSWAPKSVLFPSNVTARELRFTALSGYGKDSSAAIAELAVLYAGSKRKAGDSGTMEYRRSRSTSSDVDEGGEAPAATNSVPRL